jgi:hypothetical protein
MPFDSLTWSVKLADWKHRLFTEPLIPPWMPLSAIESGPSMPNNHSERANNPAHSKEDTKSRPVLCFLT